MTLIEKKEYNFAYIKVNIAYNNIFITLTDVSGKVLLKKSSGMLHFKGSKKKNPYVAGEVMKALLTDLKNLNFTVKGIVLQIRSYIKVPEIYSVIKQAHDFYEPNPDDLDDDFDDDKRNAWKKNTSPVFYVEYIKLKSHNGMRLQKERRL